MALVVLHRSSRLASRATTGHDALVPAKPFRVRRQALVVSLMSGATLLAGITVFAFRSAEAELGDGPISFWSVFILGLVVVVLPISFSAHRLLRSNRSMDAPIAFVSIVSGVVIARFQPGNLFGVGLLIVTFASVSFLRLVAWAEFRARHRPLP